MGFTYTGRGWLSPILIIVAALGGAVLGGVLLAQEDPLLALTLGIGVAMVIAAPVHRILAEALNSERTAEGRTWTDEHTVNGLPVQYYNAAPWVVAGIAFTIAVWRGVGGAAAVWALVALAAGLLVWRAARRRARRPADPEARTHTRPKLAKSRGWELGAPDQELVSRWSRGPGETGHKPLEGVVRGEIDGMRVTVFDTRPPLAPSGGEPVKRHVRTVCIVHLPETYPRLRVWETWRDEDGDIPLGALVTPPLSELPLELRQAVFERPRAQDLKVFSDAPEADVRTVVTEDVLRATAELGLAGWRLEGSDLALIVDGKPRSPTNAHAVRCLEALVALARVLPPSPSAVRPTGSAAG
jgi:hypothetical protein